jgi:tRNA G18 (ribose-2'-O)-methylase SpoU
MQGSIESLNVGNAAGIFIYEYFRRYRSNIRD